MTIHWVLICEVLSEGGVLGVGHIEHWKGLCGGGGGGGYIKNFTVLRLQSEIGRELLGDLWD